MTRFEFIQVLGYFLLIFLASTVLGASIIRLLRKILGAKEEKQVPMEMIGAGTLIGLVVIAYLALGAGIAGLFTKPVILSIIAASLIVSLREIIPLFRSLLGHLVNLAGEYRKAIPALIITVLSLVTLGSLYLTSLQPPFSNDELSYHLPEVRQIIDTKRVDLLFGGHLFYGNLPKLMEIIFAVGKAVSSYQLSHALNFGVFLAFLLVVFSFVKKHYGIKTAATALLFVTWFDDFTWNATGGYIDSATTAFEISALLFILDWATHKKRVNFYLSAILIGAAASIKYSPLPTAVFILGIIIFQIIRRNKARVLKVVTSITPYILVAFLFGGFWYVKNFILYRNPFYPLYFGHPGYPEESFKDLARAIHEFGPKTPAHFFELTKRFLNITDIFVFISIYLSPATLLVKKANKFRVPLFLYFILYTIYWFFLATHQIRFLSSAIIISLTMLAIVAAKIKPKYYLTLVIIVLVTSLVFSRAVRPIDWKSVWNNFWSTKFHLTERQYGLGNFSEERFLTWRFGCQYSVIKYLEDNSLEGSVIDNWSVWFAPNVSFYARKNTFQGYGVSQPFSDGEILKRLKNDNIRYIYFNSDVKKRFLASKDPFVVQSADLKLPVETMILKNSKLIFELDTCRLYQIKY